ncbi:MAG: amidohydrolase family protein [Candidatus Bathyarchaeia archaeon]
MLIDVHTHIGAYKDVKVKGIWGQITVECLLKYLNTWMIDRAVVLPIESPDTARREGYFMPTEHVLEVCNSFPERLIPFCHIDPRDPDFLQKIRRFIDLGCRGFGEHKVELRVDDPRSQEIYRLCGKLEVPVLIHMDDIYNLDSEAYEGMVRKFSNTVFIAHGPGWWKEISSKVDPKVDYPTGRVEPGGRVDHILQEYPNAYGDLSAGSGHNALQRDLEFAKDFVRRNYRKLLFGTDLVGFFDKAYNHIKLIKSLNLEDHMNQAITHKNIENMLKLK